MKTAIAHIETIRVKNLSTRQHIEALLGWTDLEYGEFQMEMGEKWLQMHIGKDAWGMDFLLQSRLFWAWWINHWNRRDEHFLQISKPMDRSWLLDEYRFINSPYTLNIRPHSVIMEASFAKMAGELIDKTHDHNR